jgi:hypothetical protein
MTQANAGSQQTTAQVVEGSAPPQQQAQGGGNQASQQQQRAPAAPRYSRADILHPSNAGGVSGAKPEVLIGLMYWRSQETGQHVTSLSREEIDEWLPQFLEREV